MPNRSGNERRGSKDTEATPDKLKKKTDSRSVMVNNENKQKKRGCDQPKKERKGRIERSKKVSEGEGSKKKKKTVARAIIFDGDEDVIDMDVKGQRTEFCSEDEREMDLGIQELTEENKDLPSSSNNNAVISQAGPSLSGNREVGGQCRENISTMDRASIGNKVQQVQ